MDSFDDDDIFDNEFIQPKRGKPTAARRKARREFIEQHPEAAKALISTIDDRHALASLSTIAQTGKTPEEIAEERVQAALLDMERKKFKLTQKQEEAIGVLGGAATHTMLVGGSRSGKTFITCRAIATRALAAPNSRHAILRFRFNHAKSSIIDDTFPKMMRLCFPQIEYKLDKTWWFYKFPNGSEIWIGGLDDKERTEKILGQEHVSIFFNECSQIPPESVDLALTRLAQNVTYESKREIDGREIKVQVPLRLKAFYDCNPPRQSHWTYEKFVRRRDPGTKKPLNDPNDYAMLYMNPADNKENLPKAYFKQLENLPAHLRERFLYGKFGTDDANALFTGEEFERWRSINDTLPDMQRIMIAVDPSGSGDKDNAHNDAIGIVVAGLGVDGNGYLLEDLTCKAGPKVWGNIVATAFDRWEADFVVGETNYGGEMVKFVVQSAKPRVPFLKVTASRGKVLRAEPISALVQQGRIRHNGNFVELEEELCGFTTNGYVGSGSPNRGDAYVWAFAALFPGIVKERAKVIDQHVDRPNYGSLGWMAA